MNDANFKLLSNIVGKSYCDQAKSSRNKREKQIKALLSSRSISDNGWDIETIKLFLSELACMDTNNFVGNVGVGEREARIYSNIISDRYYGLGHGIGRSGDIAAIQPKAAGSSLINQITNKIVKNLIKMDIKCIKNVLIFPFATGMAIVMSLLTLKQRLNNPNKKYILWPRIDQKTCLKAMITAGFQVIIIDNIMHENGHELNTNLKMIETQINKIGKHNILCILSTSSCFAPRSPDNIIEIGKICKKYDIYHVCNNAYGLQSISTCKLIQKCSEISRIDIIIQSTDKNFMVPVGGSIVASIIDAKFIDELATIYPGRASISPILDLFITLLQMGKHKWISMRKEQHENLIYFKELLNKVFNNDLDDEKRTIENETETQKDYIMINECVLNTPNNPISIGLTLNTLYCDDKNIKSVTKLGSMLFSRCVSGARIVVPGMKKKVGTFEFNNYGGHISGGYHSPYVTVTSSIGMNKNDIHQFVFRMLKCYHQLLKVKNSKNLGIMNDYMTGYK
eukprot:71614_1